MRRRFFFSAYKNIFAETGFIMYNTVSEKRLIETNFENHCRQNDVAGVGITPYSRPLANLPEGIRGNRYFLYIGRIQGDKGCKMMIDYFRSFKKNNKQYPDVKLVLAGNNYLKEQINDPDIVFMGFVSEALKHCLLKHCTALVIPSYYESLSLVTLEAMMTRKPVIAYHNCEVLKDHITESESGSTFVSEEEFADVLIKYLNMDEIALNTEGDNAWRYVNERYSWEHILSKFHTAINSLP